MNDLELIRLRMRVFLSIRYMVFHLTMNDGTINQKLKDNPIKKDDREIAKWIIGNSYES